MHWIHTRTAARPSMHVRAPSPVSDDSAPALRPLPDFSLSPMLPLPQHTSTRRTALRCNPRPGGCPQTVGRARPTIARSQRAAERHPPSPSPLTPARSARGTTFEWQVYGIKSPDCG